MDRNTEIALLEELAGLKANGMFFLDPEVAASPVKRYTPPERFGAEMRSLFRGTPLIAAHASEPSEPDSFMTRAAFPACRCF